MIRIRSTVLLAVLAIVLNGDACMARLAAAGTDADHADGVSRVLEGLTTEGVGESKNRDSAEAKCQVMDQNGTDITHKKVVSEVYRGKKREVVRCDSSKACMDMVINNCEVVYCEGMEACEGAQIVDPKIALDCQGTHSCHRSDLVLTQEDKGEGTFTVNCQGSGACNVAQLISMHKPMDVTCDGPKSCRKARIEAKDGRVECKNGGQRYEACRGSVSIDAKCLVCNGPKSCGEHINVCKFTHGNSGWQICSSDKSFGDC